MPRKKKKDNWFLDMIFFIPELIIWPIKLIIRAFTALIRYWT